MITDPENSPREGAPAGLETLVLRSGDVTVLAAIGEIDPTTAEQFASVVDAAVSTSSKVVIDLGAVSFMDSTGIRVLIQGFQHAAHPEELVLRGPSDPVRRVLAITALDELIPIEGERTPTSRDRT
jgi:anti-anti-sigma factor